MPQAVPLVAAAFATVSAAAATFVTSLTFGSGLMAGLAAWGKVAMWTALGASLMQKPPSLGSQGQQVNIQLAGPQAPLPIILGRTGTQGVITYRETYDGENRVLLVDSVLSVGPINAVTGFSVMGRSLGWSGNPSSGLATVTSVSGVDMVKSKLFREQGFKFTHRRGLPTDTATLSQITGDNVPNMSPSDGMPGLARTVLRLRLDEKQLNFPQGFPDDPISVVEGVLAYDPRLDSTFPGGSGPHRVADRSSHTWSDNPYILGLNFALGYFGPQGTKMFGLGADIDSIDVAAFVSAANVADANGWKCGGQVTTADGRWAILSNILASGGGVPINRAGRLSCFVRAPRVSSFTLRSHEVLGSRKITTSTPLRQRNNRIIPSYRSPDHKYEIIAGEAVSDESFVEQDNGELRTTETTFPLVQSAAQAHQLAAYELCDSREFLELEVTCKPRALNVEVGDCIEADLPELQAGQKFIVLDTKWEAASKTVNLTLKAETTSKHAFCLGQSQVAPLPPTLIDFDPTRPTAPDPAAWAITATEVVTMIDTNVAPEGEPVDIQPVLYSSIPALVVTGEVNNPTVWKVITDVRPSPIPEGEDFEEFGWSLANEGSRTTTEFRVGPLEPNRAYEVSLRYETNLGAQSDRLILGPQTTGAAIAPGVRPGGVDWTGPVIVNRPPVLTDLLEGRIRADLVALSGEVTRTVEDALLDVEEAQETAQGILDGVFDELYAESTGLVNRVISLESSGPDGQLVARVTGLESRVDGDGTPQNPGALARLTTVEQTAITLTNGLATRATTTVTNQLTSDLSGLSGTVTNLQQTVSDGLSGKVNVTDFTNLTGRVTSAEGSISGQNSRLNAVEVDVAGRATSSSVSTLASEITNARNGQANLSARFTQVGQTITDGLAGKASTQSVSDLTATVNGYSGSIQSIQQVSATLEGKVDAKLGVILNANGYLSGYQLTNNGTSSTFGIQADKFILSNGSTGIVPFAVLGSTVYAQNLTLQSASSGERTVTTNTGMKVYGSNGVLRVEIGILS